MKRAGCMRRKGVKRSGRGVAERERRGVRAEKRSEGEEEVREARGEREERERRRRAGEREKREERSGGVEPGKSGRMELIMEPAGKEEGVKEEEIIKYMLIFNTLQL